MNDSQAMMSPTRPVLLSPSVKRAVLWGCAAGAIGAAIRYGMIEQEFFRRTCEAPLPLWCWPRRVLSVAADRWVYGGVALALGLLALLAPSRRALGLGAVVVGALGLALYDAGPASVGLVLGLAVAARDRS